jgi:hypothetical protein
MSLQVPSVLTLTHSSKLPSDLLSPQLTPSRPPLKRLGDSLRTSSQVSEDSSSSLRVAAMGNMGLAGCEGEESLASRRRQPALAQRNDQDRPPRRECLVQFDPARSTTTSSTQSRRTTSPVCSSGPYPICFPAPDVLNFSFDFLFYLSI